MVSFALAGSTVVRLRAPVMRALVPADASGWHRWGIYILVLVPLYQILLFGYASLLGQYRFFRKRMAVMGRGIMHLARLLRGGGMRPSAAQRAVPSHDPSASHRPGQQQRREQGT